MDTLFSLIGGMSIGIALLLIAKLILQFSQVQSARILSLLLLGSCCYVFKQFYHVDGWTLFFLHLGATSVPALFWLFTVSYFQSGGPQTGLRPLHYSLFSACMAVSVSICLQTSLAPDLSVSELYYLDFVLKAALVTMGLVEVARNWQTDLVECRRKFRAGITVSIGLFLLFALSNEFIYSGESLPRYLSYTNVTITAGLALMLGYWMLVANPTGLIEAIDDLPDELSEKIHTPATPPDTADQRWLAALQTCMQDDAFYRQNDLTIRTLASHIAIPEHHLRRLINQQLGYRNFNDYLNRFRIREATERLQDPAQSRLPITTIALESGYASLTTFNKAFKALTDMTPTEFRRSQH